MSFLFAPILANVADCRPSVDCILWNCDSKDTNFATGCNCFLERITMTREIGIGILGGGYMGKAHAVAMSAVGAVFNTGLRPRLEMVCASTPDSAERYREAYGFNRATG